MVNATGSAILVHLLLMGSNPEESSNNTKKNHTDGKPDKENKGTVEEHVSDTNKRLYKEVHDKFDGRQEFC